MKDSQNTGAKQLYLPGFEPDRPGVESKWCSHCTAETPIADLTDWGWERVCPDCMVQLEVRNKPRKVEQKGHKKWHLKQ